MLTRVNRRLRAAAREGAQRIERIARRLRIGIALHHVPARSEAAGTPAEVFDAVYERNVWGSTESKSGPGSTLEFTRAYRDHLASFLREIEAKSMLDAPCGDLNWIGEVLAAAPPMAYIGGDIAPRVVAAAQARRPDLDIRRFDICCDSFPNVDVWHCRHCLGHLPFSMVKQALRNFAISRVKYALLTTNRALLLRNLDAEVGGYRYLDLQRAPISLPKPVKFINDQLPGRGFPQLTGVWTRDQIQRAVARW